jgi:hypothetical protein
MCSSLATSSALRSAESVGGAAAGSLSSSRAVTAQGSRSRRTRSLLTISPPQAPRAPTYHDRMVPVHGRSVLGRGSRGRARGGSRLPAVLWHRSWETPLQPVSPGRGARRDGRRGDSTRQSITASSRGLRDRRSEGRRAANPLSATRFWVDIRSTDRRYQASARRMPDRRTRPSQET